MYGAVALPGKATAVVGMRRAGKTTYLHQVRRERLAGGVERERLVHVDLEDEQLAGIGADELRILVEEYYRAEAGAIHRDATRRLLVPTADTAPADVPRGVVVQPAYEWMRAGAG